MGSGDVLELRADDPITRQDFPAWCREFGHDLADIREETGSFVFTVLKK
jgi:TusA-related sulfurtransferase